MFRKYHIQNDQNSTGICYLFSNCTCMCVTLVASVYQFVGRYVQVNDKKKLKDYHFCTVW